MHNKYDKILGQYRQNDQNAVDIRDYGAKCDGTDDHVAIESAITAGNKVLWFPQNTLWIPTGNLIPSGITIIGEDWMSDIIQSTTADSVYLTIGSGTICKNVAFYDAFGIAMGLSPNYKRPVGTIFNASSSHTHTVQNYPLEASVTYVGDGGNDRPAHAVLNYGRGDSYYCVDSRGQLSTGFRADYYGDGKAHYVDLKANSTGYGFYAVVESGSTARPFYSEVKTDVASLTIAPSFTTGNDIVITTSAKTGGNFINIYHATSAFNGVGIIMNIGNAGGTFTGKFLDFRNSGVIKFTIDSQGGVNCSYVIASNALAGTKTYYVADSLTDTSTRKLTFLNGILTSET
jgi:hypothetical protein